MKKLNRICAKIKDGFKTLFISNKKAGNQFMYDSTSYVLVPFMSRYVRL